MFKMGSDTKGLFCFQQPVLYDRTFEGIHKECVKEQWMHVCWIAIKWLSVLVAFNMHKNSLNNIYSYLTYEHIDLLLITFVLYDPQLMSRFKT